MTQNASKQGSFGSLGAIRLFIFLPCTWGLGLQEEFPLIRTRFGPEIRHFGSESGPNRVKSRSKSGPDQVRGEGFGGGRVQRGRSGWEGSVAPPESLDLIVTRTPALLFLRSGRRRPRQGTEICNFGAPSPLEALHWRLSTGFFACSPGFMCNLVRRDP